MSAWSDNTFPINGTQWGVNPFAGAEQNQGGSNASGSQLPWTGRYVDSNATGGFNSTPTSGPLANNSAGIISKMEELSQTPPEGANQAEQAIISQMNQAVGQMTRSYQAQGLGSSGVLQQAVERLKAPYLNQIAMARQQAATSARNAQLGVQSAALNQANQDRQFAFAQQQAGLQNERYNNPPGQILSAGGLLRGVRPQPGTYRGIEDQIGENDPVYYSSPRYNPDPYQYS